MPRVTLILGWCQQQYFPFVSRGFERPVNLSAPVNSMIYCWIITSIYQRCAINPNTFVFINNTIWPVIGHVWHGKTIENNFHIISDNASRYCTLKGVWDLSNYANCDHITSHNRTCNDLDFDLRCSAYHTSIIYYVGYSVSLVALILAVIVFMNFK